MGWVYAYLFMLWVFALFFAHAFLPTPVIKKGDSMYNFLLGFVSMAVVAIIIISYNPTPEIETVCGKCGSPEWWFVIAEGDKHDSNN